MHQDNVSYLVNRYHTNNTVLVSIANLISKGERESMTAREIKERLDSGLMSDSEATLLALDAMRYCESVEEFDKLSAIVTAGTQ